MEDQKAPTIAKCLAVDIIAKYGAPENVLTDRGTNFLSKLVKEICLIFKVNQLRTTAYHPQTDGLVERFNRTLCDMLACYVTEEPQEWDKYLPFVTLAYNTAIQSTLKECPFYLFFGRAPVLPTDVKINTRYDRIGEENNVYQRKWERAKDLAREHLVKEQKKQKGYYDRGTNIANYKIGDHVLLKAPPTPGKFVNRWREEVYKITKIFSHLNYEITDVATHDGTKIVHANNIKLFKDHSPKNVRQGNPQYIQIGVPVEELHLHITPVEGVPPTPSPSPEPAKAEAESSTNEKSTQTIKSENQEEILQSISHQTMDDINSSRKHRRPRVNRVVSAEQWSIQQPTVGNYWTRPSQANNLPNLARRGPGRPRRVPNHPVTRNQHRNEAQDSPNVRRGPGRPRKYFTNHQSLQPRFNVTVVNTNNQQKRGPGRPRKISKIENGLPNERRDGASEHINGTSNQLRNAYPLRKDKNALNSSRYSRYSLRSKSNR